MLFTDDGKVLGNTWSAGLFGDFFVGGVELLAGLPEDVAAEGVDGLLEDDDLGGLTRDDFVALGDLV